MQRWFGEYSAALGFGALYLQNPRGISAATRSKQIELIRALNTRRQEVVGDPAIAARIQQYELAFRMQTEAPDLVDIDDFPMAFRHRYRWSRPGAGSGRYR